MSITTLFQPFSWLFDEQRNDARLVLIAEARDVAAGAAEIVALIERDDIDSCSGDEDGNALPPLLPPSTRGNLLRLAVTSLERLTASLDDCMGRSCEATGQARDAASLALLIPADPRAGQVLNAEDAASLARLRELLQGKAVPQ